MMPDYTFMFTVRGISPQKAGAIGTRIEQRLGDDDVVVSAVNTSRVTVSFHVVSVDTNTREVFEDDVEATDEQAARNEIETSTRVVAMIHEGS